MGILNGLYEASNLRNQDNWRTRRILRNIHQWLWITLQASTSTLSTRRLQQEQLSSGAAAKATKHSLSDNSSRDMEELQLTTTAAVAAVMISSCRRPDEAAQCTSFAQSARCC